MDDWGQRENRRHRKDCSKGGHTPWNVVPPYQMKDQDAFIMNTKIRMVFAEREAAVEERDRALEERELLIQQRDTALAERDTALAERDTAPYQMKDQDAFIMNTKIRMVFAERDAAAEERDRALQERELLIQQRDTALAERDTALAERDTLIKERDNAIAALRFECTMNGKVGYTSRGTKRPNQPKSHRKSTNSGCFKRDVPITDVFPISAISSEAAKALQVKRTKVNRGMSTKLEKSPRKTKKVNEDLNRHLTTDGSKAEWDAQDLGSINLIKFDESTMPIPVCTCTGLPRQCYKWGSGGWQSSCCTTYLSEYPLPQLPNKRHARIGGRKMSGSVYSRLLTRLAAAGHDLSMPVDLKTYWAKHGTNRYITIK